MSDVFRNRVLPLSSKRQPRGIAVVHIVLEESYIPPTEILRGNTYLKVINMALAESFHVCVHEKPYMYV